MSLVLLGILNSQAAGAGGAGAYDLLETQVLSTSASSVTFTGLGSYSDYKHLQLRMALRGDRAASQSAVYAEYNGDTTTSNYRSHYLAGGGASVNSGALTSLNQFVVAPAASETATDSFAPAVVDILDFSNSSKYTTARSLTGHKSDLAYSIRLFSTLWMNTAAVTSIKLYPVAGGLDAGSRLSLYGVK
jgi:hypothetical protein